MEEPGDNELHIAVRKGDVKLVGELLDNEVIVNSFNTKRETALHLAVKMACQNKLNSEYKTFITIVDKLLDKGASIDIQNSEGNTSLYIAVSNSDRDMVLKLLNRGANMYVINNSGKNSLDISCYDDLSCVLIENSFIKPTGEQLHALLYRATTFNHFMVVEKILDLGVTVDLKNTEGKTPLHIAAQNNLCVLIDKFLDRGANIEAQDIFGRTPLFDATANSSIFGIAKLIRRGANLNIEYYKNNTPLHSFVSKNELAFVFDLFERGMMFVDVRNDKGFTPLHLAAIHLFDTVAVKLIVEGADVNARNNKGETPLHCAIFYVAQNDFENKKESLIDFVDILIENGADIEAKTNKSMTPLLLGLKKGNDLIVTHLLCLGADFNAYADHSGYQFCTNPLVETNFFVMILQLSLAGLLYTENTNFKKYENQLLRLCFADAMIKELKVIKETFVYENVSLNIIFSKYKNPHYVSNTELVNAIELKLANSCSDFFHYGKILRTVFKKSQKDFHILHFSNHALCNLLKNENMEFPIEIIHTISQYLDDRAKYQIVRIGVFSDLKAS